MSKVIDMKKAHSMIMESVTTAFECVLDQIEEQCAVVADDTEYTAYWETLGDGKKFCSNCGGRPLYNSKGRIVYSDYCPHCGREMIDTEGE